jgi:multiple sugar transport system permease protein
VVASALAWMSVLNPRIGLFGIAFSSVGLDSVNWLGDPRVAPTTLRIVEGLTTVGIACTAGLVFHLAALRGAGEGASSWRRVWLPLIVSWVVGLLAVVIIPLPAFGASWVLGGPVGGSVGVLTTLGTVIYKVTLVYADIGLGAALATLILVPALVLGLAAGLVVVFSRLRIEIVPQRTRSGLFSGEGKPRWRRIVAIVVLVGVLLCSALPCVLSALPGVWSVLSSLKSEAQITEPQSPLFPARPRTYVYEGKEYDVYRVPTDDGVKEWALVTPRREESVFVDPANPDAGPIEWEGNWRTLDRVWGLGPQWANYAVLQENLGMSPMQVGIRSILVPLLNILLVQVPIAYLGALGIGVAQPFKKRSDLLLLLFSPWLFVTIVPLSMIFYMGWQRAGLVGTVAGLGPPIALSVPMLFILTMFFKGCEPKWRAARAAGESLKAFFTTLFLPSLPLVALLACASLFFNAQNLLWQLAVGATKPDSFTAGVQLLYYSQQYVRMPNLTAAAAIVLSLPTFLFFFLAFGLLQALYADRLALVASRPDGVSDEVSPPGMELTREVREPAHLAPEEARKTVRLEEEDARKTVRLEPESDDVEA